MKEILQPETHNIFAQCGIDTRYVSQKPIGWGLMHDVYGYTVPGEPKKVIKVPKIDAIGLMHEGLADEAENIRLVQKFFGTYAVPTIIKPAPDGKNYVIVQDFVEGKPVTSHTESTAIRAQISDIIRLNREMMRQVGRSLDFIGMDGAKGWFFHQVGKFFNKESEFAITNLIEDAQGNIRLIDCDTFAFSEHIPIKQKAASQLSFLVNRVMMQWYFGLSIKP